MPSLRSWNQKGFSLRLRAALYLRVATQKDLARALHVAPNTVSRWRRSTAHYPSLDHLEAAADFLKVDVAWLAFGRGAAPPEFAVLTEKPKILRVSTRRIGEAQRSDLAQRAKPQKRKASKIRKEQHEDLMAALLPPEGTP